MTSRSFFPRIDQLLTSDRFILFSDQQVLVRDNRFVWDHAQIEQHLNSDVEMLLLDDGEESFIAAHVSDTYLKALDAEQRSLRSLLFVESEHEFALAGKANQLLDWYNSHRYCGTCGSQTSHHESQRAVVCLNCQHHYFPRINPCVIVLVVRGDEVLLARHARFKGGYVSCLAGFIEVGESAEDTIHREVMEEVNVEVENIRYIKSQSWPFPSQLMLGFLADYKCGEIVPELEEIEEAHWYSVHDLPQVPSASISVAGELIQYYVQQVKRGSL